MSMIPVLCCCNPQNQMGFLPEGSSSLPKDEYGSDKDGWMMAFSSHGKKLKDLLAIIGFEPFKGIHKKGKQGKTWRKRMG